MIVKYNPLSFRQSDDSIKYSIYDILKSNIINDKICFIGGEMMFYYYLLLPSTYLLFTDYQSIYDDALLNIKNNIYLVDYNNININIDVTYTLILNTSKSGLGSNLSKKIEKLKNKEIIIISCNIKSFIRDFDILSNSYKIINVYEIKTNYSVYVYILNKINKIN